MASIDNLKTILQGANISDGRQRFVVYKEDDSVTNKNSINLYYTGDNNWVSEITKKASYYRNRIQVVVRHQNKTTAREKSYELLEYINARRKTLSGVYFIPFDTPIFLGMDNTSSYIYGFNVDAKGAL